jgi:predicted small lipoprotein YifL
MTNFPPRATRHALFIGFALLLVTLLAACGKKGPVLPRLAALPVAPAELRIDQQGDSFLVSWEIPSVNDDGAPAEDLAGFRLYRLSYDAAAGCPDCRDPEQRVAAIALNHPAPAVRVGKRLFWRDDAAAPGRGYVYLVVPVTIGGHEGGKAKRERTYLAPPAPPRAVQAVAGVRQVALSWEPPAEVPAGAELVGYNLYRRGPDEPFLPLPLNPAPLTETKLTDYAAPPGRATGYRITTVTRSGDQLVESLPSAEVTATVSAAGE